MKQGMQYVGHLVSVLAWPALYVYFRIGPSRTRVLVVAEQHVLLVQEWIGDGRWSLPGGGLHRHESPARGAVRELYEETKLNLAPTDLKLVGSEWRQSRGLKAFCHFLVAEVDRPLLPRPQRREISAAEWILLDRLAETPHTAEIDRALELLAPGK